jgi:hypothetical protein
MALFILLYYPEKIQDKYLVMEALYIWPKLYKFLDNKIMATSYIWTQEISFKEALNPQQQLVQDK